MSEFSECAKYMESNGIVSNFPENCSKSSVNPKMVTLTFECNDLNAII